jgi:hypothetical protein
VAPEDKAMNQVESFQREHLNHLGEKLGVDGFIGPQTRWALSIADQHPFRRQAVERALVHIGIHEEPMGSNRGALIDHWLRRCGVFVPKDNRPMPQNAWCAAFVSYCLSVPGYEEVRIAAVRDLVKKYTEIPFEETLPGDLGFLLKDDGDTNPNNDMGHVWLLTGRDLLTRQTMQIEGNTGNKVACTRRGVQRYLRTMTLPTMPGIPNGVPLAGNLTR